jgi:hypothetical protein
MSLTDLAGDLGMDAPAMSRAANDLERRGYVARGTHATNGRLRILTLTDAGRSLMNPGGPLDRPAPAFLAGLSSDQLEDLARVMDAVDVNVRIQGGIRHGPGRPITAVAASPGRRSRSDRQTRHADGQERPARPAPTR